MIEMKRCVNCGRVVDDAIKECPICHSTNFEQQMNQKSETIDFKSVTSGDTKPSVSRIKKNHNFLILGLVIGIDEFISTILLIRGIHYWHEAKYYLKETEGYFDSQLCATLALILFVIAVGMEIVLFLFIIAFNQSQKIKLDLLSIQGKEE